MKNFFANDESPQTKTNGFPVDSGGQTTLRRKPKNKHSSRPANWRAFWCREKKIILLIVTALIFRIIFARFGTLDLDFNAFFSWSNKVYIDGPKFFYNNWSDYLPGYIYILWFLSFLKTVFGFDNLFLLFKSPAIFADIATGIIIYSAVSKINRKLSLVSSFLYLFNPAVIFNSTLWGQVDSVSSLLALIAVYFSQQSFLLSSLSLAFGTLVKPQVGFIAPFIAAVWLKKSGIIKSFTWSIFTGIIFVLAFIPFNNTSSLILFIIQRIETTANQYPFSSINAFNFWALIDGFWKSDLGLPQVFGSLFSVLFSIVFISVFYFRKTGEEEKQANKFLLSSLIFSIFFLFLTRMHERHLLPALAPLVIASSFFPILYIPYVLFSITYVLNLLFSFIWINKNLFIFSQISINFFILLNLVSFFILIAVFLKPRIFSSFNLYLKRAKLIFVKLFQKDTLEQDIRTKTSFLILLVILLFSFIMRVVLLSQPSKFYFDEIYHAFTAGQMLNGNTASWEWWHKPLPGVAYEWTHPPLAKFFMVLGMKILGENPIGWRIPGAVLGTATVFLVYLLAKEFFKKEKVSLLAAGLFSLSGLALTMSRIGMNDIYFLFFSLLTIYLFIKDRYFLSSIFLGMALSAKWTSIFILPMLFVLLILENKPLSKKLLYFLINPALLYLLFYTPFFLTHSTEQFIELQKQMYWYHTRLVATHPYSSSFWSWPLMLRPVWVFLGNKDLLTSKIFIMDNPILYWISFIALIKAFLTIIFNQNKKNVLLLFLWGSFFIPWAFSPRIMFFYHYLPALPFATIITAGVLDQVKQKIAISCLLLIFVSFFFFLPHFIGIPISPFYDNLLYWLPTWR